MADAEVQGVGDIIAQSGPILRIIAGGNGRIAEVVKIAHVAAKRLGAALGQTDIVVVRPFGRGKALNVDMCDGSVAIAADILYRLNDFGQFGAVTHIVGFQLGAVDNESDERTSLD